uniref:Uncharacterized protein n=1 Tax=Knipowitschia caucasica TaxID=637954 RepID=A0AAV2LWP0_KNICA
MRPSVLISIQPYINGARLCEDSLMSPSLSPYSSSLVHYPHRGHERFGVFGSCPTERRRWRSEGVPGFPFDPLQNGGSGEA